jgi:hypothetical protein
VITNAIARTGKMLKDSFSDDSTYMRSLRDPKASSIFPSRGKNIMPRIQASEIRQRMDEGTWPEDALGKDFFIGDVKKSLAMPFWRDGIRAMNAL